MYYCAEHQVAFETGRQWSGHCLHAHPGEPRQKAAEVFVEQVPEGTTIVHPPAHRPPRAPPPPGNPANDRTVSFTEQPSIGDFSSPYQDDDEVHLDELLDGIGVPQAQRLTIVKGWRIFPVLHLHPSNLETHIVGIVGPKFRGQVRLVVDAMFPGAEQEAPAAQYMYGPPPYGRPNSMGWPGQSAPPYSRPWEMDPYFHGYTPYYRQGPQSAAKTEADPQVVELQKKFDGILGVLDTERAERAKERQEQREKERDAALQAQINTLGSKVDGVFSEVSTLVKGLSDQIQRGHTEGETSQNQQLAQKIETLTEKIADQREAQLLGTVDALRGQIDTLDKKLNAEPTGKTTEDLIATGIPLAINKLDAMGNMIGGELKGIREQAADGKLPNLNVPKTGGAGKAGDPTDPVKAAQQIAGARAVEDKVLELASRQPRS